VRERKSPYRLLTPVKDTFGGDVGGDPEEDMNTPSQEEEAAKREKIMPMLQTSWWMVHEG
jgi:hypothetical protein